jgi:hypothetical protein
MNNRRAKKNKTVPGSHYHGSCGIALPRRHRCALIPIILTVVLLYGCSGVDTGRAVDESAYTGTIKLACIGKSITYGYGIEDRMIADASRQWRVHPQKGDLMKSSVTNLAMALGLVAIGVAIGAGGIYLGDTDDAPGAALIGILLMVGAVVLGVRIARRKT